MKFAGVFPGQGSQHVGMGKELFDNFSIARQTFEEASDAIKFNLKKLCFEGPESELKLTANTQPALLVTSVVAWRIFTSETGAKASYVLGHSLGEFSALVASHAMSLSTAIQTVRLRGQAMQEAVPVGTGGMTAVLGMEDSQVIRACQDYRVKAQASGLSDCVLEPANFNSPGQVVVSGHQNALDFFKENLKAQEYGANRAKLISLPVSAPFHCSLMKPAAERLKKHLEKTEFSRLEIPVIHNVTSKENQEASKLASLLFEQVTQPVLWTSSIQRAEQLGATHFIEFGAGKILSGLIKKISAQAQVFDTNSLENLKLCLGLVK